MNNCEDTAKFLDEMHEGDRGYEEQRRREYEQRRIEEERRRRERYRDYDY